MMTKKFFLPVLSVLMIALCLTGSAQADTFTMDNSILKVGIDNSGGLVNLTGSQQGITYKPAGVPNDFTLPGTPFEFFSIGVGGSYVTNGVYGSSVNDMGLTTFNTSSSTESSAFSFRTIGSIEIGAATLSYVQQVYLQNNTIKFSSSIWNKGTTAIDHLLFARGLDPDQDVLAGGGYETNNSYLAGGSVLAEGPKTHLTVRIDNLPNPVDGVASIYSLPWTTNPYALLANAGLNDGYADSSINMVWDIKQLTPGQSVELDYSYTFSQVPVPTSVLMLAPGLLGLLGLRRKKTVA